MTVRNCEYTYKSRGNPSGKNGEKLAHMIASVLDDIKEVRAICDLGCGNGFLANYLVTRGYEVVGIDSSISGIEQAKRSYGGGCQFICAEIQEGLVDSIDVGCFDAVLSSEVIEHLYRPADLIVTAKKLLKQGGSIIVTTPYHGYLKNIAISLIALSDRHYDPLWDGGHIKFFSRKTLEKLLFEYGFGEIKFRYYGRGPWLWKSMICIGVKL